jgi:hypothetical protein
MDFTMLATFNVTIVLVVMDLFFLVDLEDMFKILQARTL